MNDPYEFGPRLEVAGDPGGSSLHRRADMAHDFVEDGDMVRIGDEVGLLARNPEFDLPGAGIAHPAVGGRFRGTLALSNTPRPTRRANTFLLRRHLVSTSSLVDT